MFYPYDFFAEGLEIPKNIKFEKPLKLIDDRGRASSDKQDFVLYDYLQPGMYKYDLFLNKIEKGKVYLKIFEVIKYYLKKVLEQKVKCL
ncbi:hypothetical protein C1631_003865 [Chryseobacterium phosphatilyticum]|uniref:Uncharacterized protein n=1 Tax=Chryseobacterium phosphatilyticum TaxID=475075 RepID=A0A316XD38_9FLAO|nr:hypothetical protein [Chryseobacterium phosphatilyticum]PWN71771.1 hypothetical protein C1631_003865 [Chryseobacterium phosphatilyticum]